MKIGRSFRDPFKSPSSRTSKIVFKIGFAATMARPQPVSVARLSSGRKARIGPQSACAAAAIKRPTVARTFAR